ncbi:hypothetical protein AMTR_s00139p00021480 [Amborella trichopoda]|uniref:Uncharacterized protein n=1 Tax=Amborella trichopoda TaxID=13333 RepID=W1NF93_AMBTC|nr:hypothetical protein AMTR_s00139p00021480 [Amborella trichopoda]
MQSEGNGCLPGLINKKSVHFHESMGKQLGELQEHLGTREEMSISRVAIFPPRQYSFAFFDKEFQKEYGKYEKQG